MTQRYSREIEHLAQTFAWAEAADIQPLQRAIRSAACGPLRAVGSGGSLSSAHALANLHQLYTGHLAGVATPLEVAEQPLDVATAVWLVSAGGTNVDILAAAKVMILREPRQLGVLCARENSALAQLCGKHDYVDLFLHTPPVQRDGFLATNSLLGFVALLTRAYITTFGVEDDWRQAALYIRELLPDTSAVRKTWVHATRQLWERPTTVVLHGPSPGLGRLILNPSSPNPRWVILRSLIIGISPMVGIIGSPNAEIRAQFWPSSQMPIVTSLNARSS